ncbi:MAG: hypothetical protein Q9181_006287, partial [Wetmoreana brouardii]
MDNQTLPNSQNSVSTLNSDPDAGRPTSPIRSSQSNGSKPRARPTITPRTFTRFFTPRSSMTRGSKISASRRALKDITASTSNRSLNIFNIRRRSPKKNSISISKDIEAATAEPARKKRKIQTPASPDVTPDHSSPLKRVSGPVFDILQDNDSDHESGVDEKDQGEELRLGDICGGGKTTRLLGPIVRSKQRGVLGGLLSRKLGVRTALQQQRPMCSGQDWQFETANFYTAPNDCHLCDNLGDPTENAIPFCTESCNNNSLVAVGDEEGGIRLLETARAGKPCFQKAYLTFRPHTNAILDLAFSPDDSLLATASGDQTSQIIDMPTQRTICTLAAHSSSLKQVMFQPKSRNVIATSSRDGSVRLWDLRCKGSDTPVHGLKISLDGPEDELASRRLTKRMTYGRFVDAIVGAHSSRALLPSYAASKTTDLTATNDAPSKAETPSRSGDVSVTALSFLPPGREYLFLTASEADATVKLWDLRTTHFHRRSANPIPLSSTRQPKSHSKYRHFGITSMALSGDSVRLYTLCRDNTIYAYSTSHLILGCAPELASITSDTNRRSRFSRTVEKEGLGPLYGFRHPQFHATTFYVKLDVRPAKDERSELLAVGSSDGCAVVFPTDERYMRHADDTRGSHPQSMTMQNGYATPPPSAPPSLTRTTSLKRLNDTIPIYTHGTPLIRGHSREVTGLSWAYGGELVT